jgi:hypothetical protein
VEVRIDCSCPSSSTIIFASMPKIRSILPVVQIVVIHFGNILFIVYLSLHKNAVAERIRLIIFKGDLATRVTDVYPPPLLITGSLFSLSSWL